MPTGIVRTEAAAGGEAPALYRDLAGKVAVVTGGSRGLGAATCRALAANGVRVAVNGRDRAAIDAVVEELQRVGTEAAAAPGDCTDPAALEQLRGRVEQQLGPVDVVAAFAGGGRQPQPTLEITEQDWRADIDRNLLSTFLTVKTFLPGMIDRHRGSIITMASAAARHPGGAPIAYAAAKAGVIVFSQQVAHEVGPAGVRVNCLSPSTVVNERMEQAIPAETRRQMATTYPLRRLGVPDDVAQAALFLASDASSWITGATLDIAGGQVMT
jgi:3-oxoacyl-[acyl-carrier protein] reductase